MAVQMLQRWGLSADPLQLQDGAGQAAGRKPCAGWCCLPNDVTEASEKKLKVACFGARSFGSSVARMLGQAVVDNPEFKDTMVMWVHDEHCDGEALADRINRTHENPKYMPGLHFPSNVIATHDAKAAAADADVLVLVLRQGSMVKVLDEIRDVVKRTATAVIMSKDYLETLGDGRLQFASDLVGSSLDVSTAVLMGGTLAPDVAAGQFAEATLGCDDPNISKQLLKLFNRPTFSVASVLAAHAVELFAVLKTAVALASGFCDGLGTGANTKSAVVRLGAVELERFVRRFYPAQPSVEALHSACGWSDLIVSTFGRSRNRLCAEAFARDPSRSWEALAGEFLDSAEPPSGVRITEAVAGFVRSQALEHEFPFICKVHGIMSRRDPVGSLTSMAVTPLPSGCSSEAKRVAIMGSGNWGSALGRIVGENVKNLADFDTTVKMWVFEEVVDGQKLTDIINTRHRNLRYLPGYDLPPNLIAVPDAQEVAKDADILVFVLPHQFLDRLLDEIAPVVKPGAVAISMIKGHIVVKDGGVSMKTGTQVIAERLGLPGCAVLNGANVANDVASGNFAEATLGCADAAQALLLARLFNSPQFSVRTTPDVLGVELFGSVKNTVALAAGFSDGLGLAASTKAAVLRRGLREMAQLVRALSPSSKAETVLESCGIADLLTTCYSGRNRKCSEAFARDPSKGWEDVERELLDGQKLQGPSCCMDMQALIDHRNLQATFPLLTAIHAAATKKISPRDAFVNTGFLVS